MLISFRVGGNFQDLVTRSLTGLIGAAWGGFAYAARDGDPYVMAVFAAIYMIPMMYRFTQSSHPRSGIVGTSKPSIHSIHNANNAQDASASLSFHSVHPIFMAPSQSKPLHGLVQWLLWSAWYLLLW
jgi:hypothetical protein